ncbi:glycine cleavage system protein GcvH [candidate division KSB1 bacterium]|nr:MAG: glycine cleavage system protein GcvH [candidate division KSB1 bacterium]
MEVPNDLLYTREHEWALVEDDTVTVGITDYAQSELGDVVFVELPNVGDPTTQNEAFGTIEAVKTVAELYAPVSGEITDINTKLEDQPELINKDPYGEGWMIKIKFSDKSELEDLLKPEEYKNLIKKD